MMVLRLVAEVPAAPVDVAPILVEPMHDVFVLLVSLMMHLHGPLEGGAEVAIEGDEAACIVEAAEKSRVHVFERAVDFPELPVPLVQLV